MILHVVEPGCAASGHPSSTEHDRNPLRSPQHRHNVHAAGYHPVRNTSGTISVSCGWAEGCWEARQGRSRRRAQTRAGSRHSWLVAVGMRSERAIRSKRPLCDRCIWVTADVEHVPDPSTRTERRPFLFLSFSPPSHSVHAANTPSRVAGYPLVHRWICCKG